METNIDANNFFDLSFLNGDNYGHILENYGINYETVGSYIYVGPTPSGKDKLIYFSCILSQIPYLLNVLIPELSNNNNSYFIVKNNQVAKACLFGQFGYNNIAKVVTVHLSGELGDQSFIKKMSALLSNFKGPRIPNTLHLGGIIYTDVINNLREANKSSTNTNRFRILHDKYIVLSTLKFDAKGDVSTGIFFKKFYQLAKFVVKEGKYCMWSDENGCDIIDKLKHQKTILEVLSPLVNVPKAIDSFYFNDNFYLIMEYINGISAENLIKNICTNRSWNQLNHYERSIIYSALLKIVDQVGKIHSLGYVHRDLSPNNLLYTKDKEIYILDFEAASSYNDENALSSDGIGTAGFMSNQQIAGNVACISDDIYSLGGIMIFFFTNMSPVKFKNMTDDAIADSILFFTGTPQIRDLVKKCFNQVEITGVTIKDIELELKKISLENTQRFRSSDYTISLIDDEVLLNSIIESAFNRLINSEMLSGGFLIKYFNVSDSRIGNTALENGEGFGFMSPITILPFLFYLMDNGRNNVPIGKFGAYLNEYISMYPRDENFDSVGILYGLAGKAITLHYAIESNILPDKVELQENILNCFGKCSNILDMGNGIAGQLSSAIAIYQSKKSDALRERIENFKDILIHMQQKDGSWINTLNRRPKSKLPFGIAYGISGILLSLIYYYKYFPDSKTKVSIELGLTCLKMNISKNDSVALPNHLNTDKSLLSGVSGIALVFLYAYEYLGLVKYKDVGEKLLIGFNDGEVDSDYSFGSGLSGLGLVYCEASRICGNELWKHRASWIYSVFFNTIKRDYKNNIYWNVNGLVVNENNHDLIKGTSGIILFLLLFLKTK